MGATCFIFGATNSVFFRALSGMLFFGSNRLQFEVVDVDLFLESKEVGLRSSMTFSRRVDLFGEDAQTPFLIVALLTDVGETVTAFGQIGLKLGLFEGQGFNHGLQFFAAGGIADGFGQLSCTLADLMFQLVDPAHQPFRS